MQQTRRRVCVRYTRQVGRANPSDCVSHVSDVGLTRQTLFSVEVGIRRMQSPSYSDQFKFPLPNSRSQGRTFRYDFDTTKQIGSQGFEWVPQSETIIPEGLSPGDHLLTSFISRLIQVSLMGDSCAPELPSPSRHWPNYVHQSRRNYISALSDLFIGTAFRRLACAIICLAIHGSYLGNGILIAKCDRGVLIFIDLL